MKMRFNTTGVCVPNKHYMVDITNKVNEIKEMIENEEYFIINRPRQYGKTTIIYAIERDLKDKYLVIPISFEGIGDSIFEDEERFSSEIFGLFGDAIELEDEDLAIKLKKLGKGCGSLKEASKVISKFIKESTKEVILIIDEVDKSSNNQLFLSFLGMLRNKYLLREVGKDYTFKSVILAGVHDIKNLKMKIRMENEQKLNSPWNIAVDFKVDMSFSIKEIKSMLDEYSSLNNINMDTTKLSEKLRYYTSGYPFLVSKLCKIIDEDILKLEKRPWSIKDIDGAIKQLLKDNNTLFDDIVKNIENNKEIYKLVEEIIIVGREIPFTISDPIISRCAMYGIISENENEKCKINNKVFELFLYNHITTRVIIENASIERYNYREKFLTEDGGLNIEGIILRFQQFMKEQFSNLDEAFIEREGRLLFLAFIKPIINGVGFDFKEVQISEEKRLDIVITYNSFKYIIELKIWNGPKYHEKGLKQLYGYLENQGLDTGYLVIYNFNKNKEYKQEYVEIDDKKLFAVYV